MAELQRVIEEAPAYAHLITGVPPGPADAQSTYTMLPEGSPMRTSSCWESMPMMRWSDAST